MQLPPKACIHSIFHVSQLEEVIGDHPGLGTLPPELAIDEPIPILFEEILSRRIVDQNGSQVPQLLIKWQGLSIEEVTWIDAVDFQGQFPTFCLEDNVASNGGGIDELIQKEMGKEQQVRGRARSTWKVYSRKPKMPVDELA